MAAAQGEYHEHHSYRSSWLAPAPLGNAANDTSAHEGGADYFGMVDFDDSRRQPFYSLDDSMEDRGTPMEGVYARDGIWDEEDDSEVLSSNLGEGSSKARSGISGAGSAGTSRAASSAAPSTARSSLRMRSRSGTVSSAKGKDAEEGDKSMWSWTRRARPSDPPALAPSPSVLDKKVQQRQSKGLLKGKGRRGELTVQVDPKETSVPPLPSTPSSYLRTPATGSPYIFSPSTPAVRGGNENSPVIRIGDDKKGSWKRGVSKLFRSKSSAVLRDITDSSNAPPQSPAIPAKFAHLQTPIDRPSKPLTASTPPMSIIQSRILPQGQKGRGRASLAPAFMSPTSPVSPSSPMSQGDAGSNQHFGLYPDLPADPFASSLTAAPGSSPPNTMDDAPLPLPVRPKPLRSSSSLQNLKDLFSLNKQPRSPGLAKTKSMANIKSRMGSTPIVTSHEAAIPEVPTPTSSTFSGRTPRATTPSKAGDGAAANDSPSPVEEVPKEPETMQEAAPVMPAASTAPPAESPPLMLPAPPFSRSGSSRLSSSPSSNVTSPGFYSSSSSSSNGTPQLSINTTTRLSSGFPFPSPSSLPPLPASAPTSPLPPLPMLPMPSMQALAECAEDESSPVHSNGSKPTSPLIPRRVVKKSSSHVLLPRSRSTSMSLKSPPTSSSFFDLYEQLGIWPTAEKKEEEEREKAAKEKMSVQTDAGGDAGEHRVAEDDKLQVEVAAVGEGLDECLPLTSMSASTSGRFSSASWEAAVNAFPDVSDLQESESSMKQVRAALQPSEDDHTVLGDTSHIAVRSISPTTSQTHTAPTSPLSTSMSMTREGSYTQTANNGQSSSTRQTAQTSGSSSNQQSSSGYTSYAAGPSRALPGGLGIGGGGGGGNGDDDDDENERWYDSLSHASDLSSEDEDEEESSDDVPLSQIHPGAAAAQKARKARQAAAKRDKRTKGKLEQIKLIGRNPGGEHGWNGEGGVPGDVLRSKLEKLFIAPVQSARSPRTASPTAHTGYPWAASAGAVRASQGQVQEQPRERVHSGGRERFDQAMRNGHVVRRPSATTLGATNVYGDKSVSRRPSRQAMQGMPPAPSHLTGYTFEQVQYGGKSPVMLSFDSLQTGPPVSVARTGSRHTSGGNSAAHSTGVSRRPTMTSSGRESHGHTPRLPQVPQMVPAAATLDLPSAGVARSNTVSSRRGPADSRSQSGRKRAVSNAAAHKPSAEAMPPLPNAHGRGATEPVRSAEKVESAAAPAPSPAPALPVIKFFVNLAASDNRLVSYPLPIDCTAHDLLAAAARSGDIVPPPGGMNWVVAELFGELNCERVLREYEEIGTVMRGWEGRKGAEGAGRNSFVIRQELGEGSLIKAIPQTAPFVGGWAQYENKGKWSKRWLETRGGQVFMAKNEKNKDEVQINTLFGDVYQVTRQIGAPRAFTFVIKRMEPEASFDKRDDWAHIFSMDEGVGYKLMSAIYDAKSFTLKPHLLARQGQQQQQQQQPVQRRPTIPSQGPLIDMPRQIKKEEKKGPFTGRGLLRL